jgi:hypothetical protein
MANKPVLLRSKSFTVTDHRRGKDYDDPESFQSLLSVFQDNMEAWEELISLVLEDDDFNTPSHVDHLEIRLMGKRKSFLGQASGRGDYIKMTPQRSNYHEGQDIETFIHELGHIATPTEYDFNGYKTRRIIHGKKFKAATYKIAQYAQVLGLMREEQVRWALGKSTHENLNTAAQKPAKQTSQFSRGDVITWEHSGHKHGGTYTGKIKRVNRKTYTVIELTKNGAPSPPGRQWKLPISKRNKYKLAS